MVAFGSSRLPYRFSAPDDCRTDTGGCEPESGGRTEAGVGLDCSLKRKSGFQASLFLLFNIKSEKSVRLEATLNF